MAVKVVNIYELLRDSKLVDAISQLKPKLDAVGEWTLLQELEEVTATYKAMLHCIVEGYDDPESKTQKKRLIKQAYSINDRANRFIRVKRHSDDQYCKTLAKLTDIKLKDTLDDLIATYSMDTSSPEKKKTAAYAYDEALGKVFNICWTADTWTAGDTELMRDVFRNDLTEDFDKAVIVSAVTLSLLEMFDDNKVMLLFDAYESKDVTVSIRALVGIIIVLIRYDARLVYYPEITSRLSLYEENETFIQECCTILMQLQYSKMTDTVTAKMVNDIMPTIAQNFGKNMSDDKFIQNGENPDWIINPQNAGSKAEKKINQMMDMQMEGADVYMSSFCHLKSFPYFSSFYRWFIPFTFRMPHTLNVVQSMRPEILRSVEGIIELSPFCDSDKYSFVMMVDQLGSSGQDILAQQIEEQKGGEAEGLNDILRRKKSENGSNAGKDIPRDKAARNICRSYIFDLYRVFNSYVYHTELFNPFDKRMDSFNPMLYKSLATIVKYGDMQTMADFFMRRGLYTDALNMFESLNPQKCEADADIWQKMGFCQQKLNSPAALQTYLTAYELQPDSKWTVQHIAQTALDQKEYRKAVEFFDKLMQNDPDNVKWILRKAEAMFGQNNFEDALPLLYKVIYIDENIRKGNEMIAWALLMTRALDKAERFYTELTEREDTTPLDSINLAHLYYVKGEVERAMKLYTDAYMKYLKDSDTEKFIKDFWYLGAYLTRIDIDTDRLSIILDAVRLEG